MLTCLVAYDIEDDKIRNKIAKYLLKIGTRLQKSVFIVQIERHTFRRLQNTLRHFADNQGKIAIFRLCEGCKNNAIQYGSDIALFYVV